MSVYFVLRTHYHHPNGKYLKRFDDETVLAWFQRHWQGFEDQGAAYEYAESIMGCKVYGLGTLFEAIATESLPCPTSYRQLSRILKEHLYSEGDILVSQGVVQAQTDDDELELAYYFFDDAFLAEEGKKATYLLHDCDRLPEAIEERFEQKKATLYSAPHGKDYPASGQKIKPEGKGAGATYIVLLAYYDSMNLMDLTGAYRLRGVRLPEFSNYLQTATPSSDWPFELELIQGISRQIADTGTTVTLGDVLNQASNFPVRTMGEEWYKITHARKAVKDRNAALRQLIESTQSATEEEKRSPFIQSDTHITQIHFHTETWDATPLFQQWIIFDDLWLNSYPELGKAILRYAARWDVLS